MRRKKKRNYTTLYFAFVSIISVLLIVLPILLKIPTVYSFIQNYLSALGPDYKNTYISTLGSIYGAFLGVTGAIWVQNIASNQEKKDTAKKNARIIYDDFRIALEQLEIIVEEMGRDGHLLFMLPNDDGSALNLMGRLREHRFSITPEWKKIVLSISDSLSADEIKLIYDIYNRLWDIYTAQSISVASRNMVDVYSIIISLFSTEKDRKHGIEINTPVKIILHKIKEIAGD